MGKTFLAIITMTLLAVSIFSSAFAEPYIVSSENLGIKTDWAKFGISIETDKKSYNSGDNLVATITPEKDCYILLYYTNEKGECLVLYPNTYESKSFLRAGESFTVGNDDSVFSLQVEDGVVRDYIQVIATDTPIDVDSLQGIREPEKFVNKLRLILAEKIRERATQLGENPSNVSMDNKVFGIGTTDYMCNAPYTPPDKVSNCASAREPVVSTKDIPEITIRLVCNLDTKSVKICGPGMAPPPPLGIVYSIDGDSARIIGTVEYGKGVKSITVNGKNAEIMPVGSSKGISLEGADTKARKIVDFRYILEGIKGEPTEVTIEAAGMDNTTTKKTIKIKHK